MPKLVVTTKYGVTPNKILNDPNLSFRAKGLFGYIQSKPDGWDFSVERIALQTKEGTSAIKSAIKELEEYGVLQRKARRNERGEWEGYSYFLYEWPLAENPLIENPPTGDIATLSKKENSKKDLENKSITCIKNKPVLDIMSCSENTTTTLKKSIAKTTKNSEQNEHSASNCKNQFKKTTSDFQQVDQVISYLNKTANTKFRFSKQSRKYIQARLLEGATYEDCCLIIDYKTAKWKDDPKMAEYLRPSTLFRPSHFEEYLVAATRWREDKIKPIIDINQQNEWNTMEQQPQVSLKTVLEQEGYTSLLKTPSYYNDAMQDTVKRR